ncbi:MAG: hypothetical protein JWP22_3394, partial [Ramlibacter sp.]|nr:hypothetical protein [Ramlibacter sp.]
DRFITLTQRSKQWLLKNAKSAT